MPDDWTDEFEMDDDGHLRRKKRVLPDGAKVTFATISDHAAYKFTSRFADGSIDHSDPHKPGFRVLDSNDASRIAAHDAYEQRRAAIDYRTRAKKRPDDEDEDDDDRESEPERRERLARKAARAMMGSDQASLDAARDRAYEERTARMQNGWRTRQP